MSRHGGLATAFFALILLATASRADSISVVSDGTGSWQSSPALNPGPGGGGTTTGTPFWNSGSWDGTAANVGYFMTGTGFFAGNSLSPNIPLANLQYWGATGGAADPTERFSSGGNDVSTQFLVHVAGNAGVNQLWYHDATGNHELYDPNSNSLGQVVSFTPVGDFSFYLVNPNAGYDFSSDSNNSSSSPANTDPGNQHFAVFQSSAGGPLYVGVEDLPLNATDADYNDLVFSIQAVPEPASVTLLVLGAAGLAVRGWRRKKLDKVMSAG